ncbi:MAG TPA: hypothetical protein EYP57_04175 [Thermodesulfobacteriaceae bacterium]|nr:hypothetical protein [Thermodesulfobacteriaceae bacterium]
MIFAGMSRTQWSGIIMLTAAAAVFWACAICAAQQLSRYIVVDKARHRLWLYRQGKAVNEFEISLGIDVMSPKLRRRDCATPEGCYQVIYKKERSKYHKFLGISYPNRKDAWLGLRYGVITAEEYRSIESALCCGKPPPSDTLLGGGVGIHGGGVFRSNGGVAGKDWTEGCIALNDDAMDMVYHFSAMGDRVIIYDSSRSFFEMMRPLTHPIARDIPEGRDENGEKYYSELLFITKFGPVLLKLGEGLDYSRAIEIIVFKNDSLLEKVFYIFDSNGDGLLGSTDSCEGTLTDLVKTMDPYIALQRELKEALGKGNIRIVEEKWKSEPK